jgi:hypothetical protein
MMNVKYIIFSILGKRKTSPPFPPPTFRNKEEIICKKTAKGSTFKCSQTEVFDTVIQYRKKGVFDYSGLKF